MFFVSPHVHLFPCLHPPQFFSNKDFLDKARPPPLYEKKNLVKIGQKLVNISQKLVKIGQDWSKLVKIGQKLVKKIWPKVQKNCFFYASP